MNKSIKGLAFNKVFREVIFKQISRMIISQLCEKWGKSVLGRGENVCKGVEVGEFARRPI